MSVMEQLKESVRDLDSALHDVITSSGWPTWETSGSGAGLPSRRRHEFGKHKLKECARIDFHRGLCSDDWMNDRWAALYHQLPKYQRLIKKCYGK